MQIRIEGTPTEIQNFLARLKNGGNFEIQNVSKPYENRGSKIVRVYVELSNENMAD